MQVSQISASLWGNNQIAQVNSHKKEYNQKVTNPVVNNNVFSKLPLNYQYGANINFKGETEFLDPNRTVANIDASGYYAMTETTKKRLRHKYANFFNNPYLEKSELFDPKQRYMPLIHERTMDKFVEISKKYNQYRDQPILCLGRSPKWFLNASLWMKGGIEDYNFVAFSENWYEVKGRHGLERRDDKEPTPEQINAFRKYLRRVKSDPQTIVNNMKETGKKTVITDFILESRGITSFLEVMGNYAKDLGILEDFTKSIEIVAIGSIDYLEDNFADEDGCVSVPKAILPQVLLPYDKNIKQTFYDMDRNVFDEILIFRNTNECRSTYYPPKAWVDYQPDKFKTGMIKDSRKIEEWKEKFKDSDCVVTFSPAMGDYRNLLTFRIIDGLASRDELVSKETLDYRDRVRKHLRKKNNINAQ